MPSYFLPPATQYVDGNGDPRDGAQAFFYQTGTNTSITVFQDGGNTVPHTQPVIADSDGIFPPIYLPDNAIKVVLLDKADVIVTERDPFIGVKLGGDATLPDLPTGVNALKGAMVQTNSIGDGLIYRPKGWIDIRDYGTSTANIGAAEIQSAIDDGTAEGRGVELYQFGYGDQYECDTTLLLDNYSALRGVNFETHTKLQFTNATGIQLRSSLTGAARTSGILIKNLSFYGNAGDTATATGIVTSGLDLRHMIYSTIQSIRVHSFVKQLRLDAGIAGSQGNHIEDVKLFAVEYPNPTNGYPQTIFELTGATKKPQANVIDVLAYSNLTTKTVFQTAVGANERIPVTLQSTTPLYKTTGIKCLKKDANGIWQPLDLTTGEYVVYDITGGSPGTALGVADQYVNKTAFEIEVPASVNSDEYQVIFNDPYTKYAVDFAGADSNFANLQVGGAEILVRVDAPDNDITIRYAQLCDYIGELTEKADNCAFKVLGDSGKTIGKGRFKAALSGKLSDAFNLTLYPNAAQQYNRRNALIDTAFTSAGTEIVEFQGLDYVEHIPYRPGPRDVHAHLGIEITRSGAVGRLEAIAFLEKSTDYGATWIDVENCVVKGEGTTLRSWFDIHYEDEELIDTQGGTIARVRYRVRGDLLQGNAGTFIGGTKERCWFGVRDVNPA